MPPAAALIPAAIGAVGSIVGGIAQGNAADAAARKQQAAAADSNRLQERMFNQQREDQAAYRQAGQNALAQMQDPSFNKTFSAADFQQDPGYAFRMAEGQKAIERSAAARGGLNSGGALRALTQYGQGFASNEYQNAYNRFNQDQQNRFGRLSQLAGFGQGANQLGAQAGQNYASQYGQNVQGAANAAGAADIAKANAFSGAVGNIAKSGGDFLMSKPGDMQGSWLSKWTGGK